MIVNRAASLSALTIALAMAGCAVGPDFHHPAAPTDSGYTPEPLRPQTASAKTRNGDGLVCAFTSGMDAEITSQNSLAYVRNSFRDGNEIRINAANDNDWLGPCQFESP